MRSSVHRTRFEKVHRASGAVEAKAGFADGKEQAVEGRDEVNLQL